MSSCHTSLPNAQMLPTMFGIKGTLCRKKKAGGEREEVKMDAHRIIGGEYFALRAGSLVHLSF